MFDAVEGRDARTAARTRLPPGTAMSEPSDCSAEGLLAAYRADPARRLGRYLLIFVLCARCGLPLPESWESAEAAVADSTMLRDAVMHAELLRAGSCVTSCT